MSNIEEARNQALNHITRRHFLQAGSMGLGALALSIIGCDGAPPAATQSIARNLLDPLSVLPPHFAPKAKRVIYLHMAGAPSQLETFDYKPVLARLNGQRCPESLLEGKRFAFIRGTPKMLGPQVGFQQYGESRAWVSDHFQKMAEHVDDVAFLKAMHTDQFNHAPAQLLVHTGSPRLGRPSIGAWVTYGLGTENQNLPAFVVLLSGGAAPDAGASVYGSGFLPTVYQGVQCRSTGDPVLFLSDPEGMSREMRRKTLDAINEINAKHHTDVGDPEILTRIAQYEMAFRMQLSVPEAMDISREPERVHLAYGTAPGRTSFANNCLLARRLVERGVRFVQLYHRGWDHHGTGRGDDLVNALPDLCRQTDRAAAALVKDLNQRGLLDSTLVIWGGEFGRTPMNEARAGSKYLGRDHHPRAFSIWMAGGGIKGGMAFGKTDELGYSPAEDAVDIHDLHATVLHLMGLDHTKLTYKFQGRDFRLTDVSGKVIGKLLA